MSVRPITDTLRHIGGGAFLDEAGEALAELVNVVSESGKGGKITLEIALKKATRGGAMHVVGKVKVTKPAEEPMEAMLFATPEGNLIADDPHQLTLGIREVAGAQDVAPANLKTVQSATA
jgi:hypothetical protein